MQPRVSVIIVSHDEVRFIAQAIQSVLAQSYSDVECILIDDGSGDGTWEAICAIADVPEAQRVRALRLGRHAGQMAAFTAGLENCSGSFVVFLPGADVLDPDFVAIHVAAHLNAAHGAAMTASNTRTLDDKGRVLEGTSCSFGQLLPDEPPLLDIAASALGGPLPARQRRPRVTYRQPIRRGWPFGTASSFMFRRDVLDMIMPRTPMAIPSCADYYLVQLASAVGGALLIHEVLGGCRVERSGPRQLSAVTGGWRKPPFARSPDLQKAIDREAERYVLKNRDRFAALLPGPFLGWFNASSPVARGISALRLGQMPWARPFPKSLRRRKKAR